MKQISFGDAVIVRDDLAAVSGRNAKKEILDDVFSATSKRYSQAVCAVFQQVMAYALDPYKQYHTLSIPNTLLEPLCLSTDKVFEYLDYLVERRGINHSEIETLARIGKESPETKRLLEYIVKKDLKCGVGIKTAALYNPTLKEFPVLLCENFKDGIKNITYPCIADKKENGGRLVMAVVDGTVSYKSRNGNIVNLFGLYNQQLLALSSENCVFDGEIIFYDIHGTPFSRKKSNGLLNKAIKGTLSKEQAGRASIHIWDIIPYDHFLNDFSEIGALKRREHLVDLFKTCPIQVPNLHLIQYDIVESLEEALSYFQSITALGGEGLVLKNFDAPWEAKRSKWYVKVTIEKECELRVAGTTPHTKKKGQIGSLFCLSDDGELEVNVGSGLDEKDRLREPEYWIGKIITVKFNEIIKAEGDKLPSLYLPILIEERFDKDHANTYKEIVAINKQKDKKGAK